MSRTGTIRKPHSPNNAGKKLGRYCQICGGWKAPGETEHKCYEVRK